MRCSLPIVAGLVIVCAGSAALAAVGNPQIKTDHPIYPGELAYSTPERLAESVIRSEWGLGLTDSERDMALRLWLWEITHTYHDYCPMTYTPLHDYYQAEAGEHDEKHPTRPDPKTGSFAADDRDYDALRWQFSYAYALCGTLHANIGPKIKAVGKALGRNWGSRRVGIPGDSNHEIYFDGSWRAFDTNAMTLLWSSNDPKTAELLPYKAAFGPKQGPNNPDLLDNAPKFNGQYLPKLTWSHYDKDNGKLADWNWMHGILANEEFYWDSDEVGHYEHGGAQSYLGAYIACPIIYTLKRGETFTRWFDGDEAKEELGLPGRIWWGTNIKGGPGSVRAWVHYIKDRPEYSADTMPLVFATDSQYNNQYSRRNMKESTHGNGLYEWRPNLRAGDWKDGVTRIEGPVRNGDGSPALTADGKASLIAHFFSPYTVAAMPADDTDPAKPGARHGAVIEADAVGAVPVEVSVNGGLTFKPIGRLEGKGARIDFTDAVKGHNQYLLRIGLDKGIGLDGLNLRTVVTMARSVYPKLRAGETTVTYLADGRGAFEATPDFRSEELARDPAVFESVEDMTWSGYADDQKTAWKIKGDAGSAVYKVTAPAGRTLDTVSAAANVIWVTPTQKGCAAELAVAPSPEGPWQTIGKIDAEADDLVNKNSSSTVHVYGQAALAGQDLTTAYVRIQIRGGGRPAGLRYLYAFGTYPTSGKAPLEITYFWKSGAEAKEHTEVVPAGVQRHMYTFETGQHVRNRKVVFAVAASE